MALAKARVLASAARAFGQALRALCASEGCPEPAHPDLTLFCTAHTRALTRATPEQCIQCHRRREDHELWCAACVAKYGRR